MSKCLNPVHAWICGTKISQDGILSPNLVFSPTAAMHYFEHICALQNMDKYSVSVPCGHCINCLMRKRKDMSVRLAHEASMHEVCCFLTLTYDNDHVPVTDWQDMSSPNKQFDRGLGNLPELTLCPRDVQLFIKRLRRNLEYHHGIKGLRYFAVGEYGSKTHRPHYHILLFGWTPDDKVVLGSKGGHPFYRSALVERLWTHGYSSVSDVSPFVAKYCARYVTKKYSHLHDIDNVYVVPEFTLQSVRNGGIGATWFDRYGVHACEVGLCTVRTSDTRISKCAIPDYYIRRLRKLHPDVFCRVRDQRLEFLKSNLCRSVSFSDLLNFAACAAYQITRESNMETF